MPKLSLCMLIRNEEDWIARCLNSVKDIVDEMIIVDIGSSDRTAEICQSLGVHVLPFSWNGSFSDARNFGLEHTTGDWILWLNADEELDGNDRNRLRSSLDKKEYLAFSLPVSTYYGESPVPQHTIQTSRIRLFQNHKNYRFIHPIHESLSIEEGEKEQKIGFLDIKIHQYGHLSSSIEKKKKKMGSRFTEDIERTFFPLFQSLVTKRNYATSFHLLEELEDIGLPSDLMSCMKGWTFMAIGLSSKAQALLSNVSSSSLYYLPALEALCALAWIEEKFDEADMYVKQIEAIAGHDKRAATFRLLHQIFTENRMDDMKEMNMAVVHEVLCKLFELKGKKQLEQLSIFAHETENAALEKRIIELAGEFGYIPMNTPSEENLQESPLSYVEHVLSQQNVPKARNLYKQILHHSPLQEDIRSKLAAITLLELKQLLSTRTHHHSNLNNLYQAVADLQSTFEIPFHKS
ncbi:glycosyltransferase family 2 protein [Aneurinibacillus migulanus]|uniref:Glycosyl transferase family 2 n=1 Tax=Aneurinibacillus migulanus TaxID=47500 RepID=A0A1G8NA31_ANEMI|nr:glycosyltransferase family 2 protein [Aneurinibacillus migulanus]MED0895483.1 glycosyltransferase family 2 protein [Aneurinibacillus migulanus]MED1618355.1 glycosyltransferase family 2 protein [Aneurinibacillus migulanus]GED13652.1 hypothetical protein AMI01nite_16430 [Aneurinibacillus migulanus]SDI76400.1 Glycosyl transferase family 2 [Aneurinibacillus migulanus]